MNLSTALRSCAVLLALAAIVDPACTRTTSAPVPVEVRPASPEAPSRALAESVRARLASSLGRRIDLDSPQPAVAVVVAGEPSDLEPIPSGVAVSSVTRTSEASPNVRVGGSTVPRVMLPGWATSISAAITATGVVGETSVIVLERERVELGRIEHEWSSANETFEASFPYVPPAAGTASMRITARALDREVTGADNHADVRVVVEDRALKILLHEPRPSWATAFIRRVLEEEPLFDVAGLVRPTRGIEVRTGAAPARLTPGALEPFDAVIVGAPEELTGGEVSALAGFARVRGGTFILVPDRRPSGPYVSLIPAASFEERLLERPVSARGPAGRLRATELALPMRVGPAVDTLARLDGLKQNLPVVISWPLGAGRGTYAGALDAWRYRGSGDDYAKFWRGSVASAASSAPRRIEAAVEPGLAAPGDMVTLRVRVRGTDVGVEGESIQIPVVSAVRTDSKGGVEPIRLWPTEETGAFEGRFEAPAPGHYLIRVASKEQAAFEAPLIVADGARTAAPAATVSQRLLVEATGGVSAGAGDLSALESHLSALPGPSVVRSIHPARSPWLMVAFISLLCVEWGLRRRGGAR